MSPSAFSGCVAGASHARRRPFWVQRPARRTACGVRPTSLTSPSGVRGGRRAAVARGGAARSVSGVDGGAGGDYGQPRGARLHLPPRRRPGLGPRRHPVRLPVVLPVGPRRRQRLGGRQRRRRALRGWGRSPLLHLVCSRDPEQATPPLLLHSDAAHTASASVRSPHMTRKGDVRCHERLRS